MPMVLFCYLDTASQEAVTNVFFRVVIFHTNPQSDSDGQRGPCNLQPGPSQYGMETRRGWMKGHDQGWGGSGRAKNKAPLSGLFSSLSSAHRGFCLSAFASLH